MRRLAYAAPLFFAAACGTSAGSPAARSGVAETPRATPTATATERPPNTPPPTATPPATKPATTKPTTTHPTTTKPPATKPAATPPRQQPPARPVAADVDGDGRADRVTIAERRDSASTGLWSLTVALANGGSVDGVVRAEPQVRPEVLGVADADADGDGEVFVRVGGGASTAAYTPYALVEDGMAEVRTPDGQALRLVVGGSVTHGDGFSCAGGRLTVTSVVSDDGTAFEGTRTAYAWDDDRVTRTGRTTFTAERGDPEVDRAYRIDCGDL